MKTRLSRKGQVLIPKAIRDARGWKAGDELLVEETKEGVSLKLAWRFPRTTIEEVAGCLEYRGPARAIEEMNEGVALGARKRK